jgi:hypothetical protein
MLRVFFSACQMEHECGREDTEESYQLPAHCKTAKSKTRTRIEWIERIGRILLWRQETLFEVSVTIRVHP